MYIVSCVNFTFADIALLEDDLVIAFFEFGHSEFQFASAKDASNADGDATGG